MKVGKVPEAVLKRSVLKQIRTNRPEVLLGASVGEDCAAVALREDEMFVLSTDPITGTAKDIGHLAIQITLNDLASAGAEPVGVMLTFLLPETALSNSSKDIINSSFSTRVIFLLEYLFSLAIKLSKILEQYYTKESADGVFVTKESLRGDGIENYVFK